MANVYREWQREGEPGSENEGPQFERWKKFIDKLKVVAASNRPPHDDYGVQEDQQQDANAIYSEKEEME